MEIDAAKFYKFTGPRTTALVTSADKQKKAAVELFSFITPVSTNPPLIMVSIGKNQLTLKNIRSIRQFVINIPSEEILDNLMVFLDKESSEDEEGRFERSHLNEVPSSKVVPPSIFECIIWLECLVEFEKEAGDRVLVVGRVVWAVAKDAVLDSNGDMDIGKAKALMHIGGKRFAVAEREINARKEEQE